MLSRTRLKRRTTTRSSKAVTDENQEVRKAGVGSRPPRREALADLHNTLQISQGKHEASKQMAQKTLPSGRVRVTRKDGTSSRATSSKATTKRKTTETSGLTERAPATKRSRVAESGNDVTAKKLKAKQQRAAAPAEQKAKSDDIFGQILSLDQDPTGLHGGDQHHKGQDDFLMLDTGCRMEEEEQDPLLNALAEEEKKIRISGKEGNYNIAAAESAQNLPPLKILEEEEANRMQQQQKKLLLLEEEQHTTTTSSSQYTGEDSVLVESDAEDENANNEDDEEVVDIDCYDIEDPLFVSEYVNDIYAFLREKELANKIDPTYMQRQMMIDAHMRCILVEWMIEVCTQFRLTTDSSYLAIDIVDRYLEKESVPQSELQLVGVGAMMIASKVEEVYAPVIKDFIFMSDEAFTREQLLAIEADILNTLDFNLSCPTSVHFLRRFSRAAGADALRHAMSKYLLELTALEYSMLRYLPSTRAAAATYLTRRIVGDAPTWNKTITYYSTYSEHDIKPCLNDLVALLQKAATTSSFVKTKYTSRKQGQVAVIADSFVKTTLAKEGRAHQQQLPFRH